MKSLWVATLISAIALSACMSQVDRDRRLLNRERRALLAEIDLEACESGGGELRYVCMFGLPACVQLFSDGGKVCTDSSECEGLCLIRTGYPGEILPAAGEQAEGKCEPDSDECGCWIKIENGVAQQEICVD